MVGGPVFGPKVHYGYLFSLIVFALVVIWLLAGCTSPKIEYHPVSAMLIPPIPELPKIESNELSCLSDDTYLKLANRDRILRQYAIECRVLLGNPP